MTAVQSPSSLTDLSRDELVRWCAVRGYPSYRADQIRRWVFEKRAGDIAEMRDLPLALRDVLTAEVPLFGTRVVRRQTARDRTEKLLLELCRGGEVETVLMREPRRRTVCLSTQVGCAMGCVFCASGLLGLERNLSTGEILDQVLHVARLLKPGERITNVVVMGIGEPLANLKALLPALATMTATNGMGLGTRRITISTVGLPEAMRELARFGKPYNLAVSLHAPNDKLRNRLVPVNRSIGIAAILAAADDYFDQTGRRITYEYVLLGGINDQERHARQLASLLADRNAHVNLIPINAVRELSFQPPAAPQTERFVARLTCSGVTVTVRKRKGADIDAACGQLRLADL